MFQSAQGFSIQPSIGATGGRSGGATSTTGGLLGPTEAASWSTSCTSSDSEHTLSFSGAAVACSLFIPRCLSLQPVVLEIVLGVFDVLELRLCAVAMLLAPQRLLKRWVHRLLVRTSSTASLESGRGVRIHRVEELLVLLLIERGRSRGRRHLVLLEVQNIGRLLPVALGCLGHVLLLTIGRKVELLGGSLWRV